MFPSLDIIDILTSRQILAIPEFLILYALSTFVVRLGFRESVLFIFLYLLNQIVIVAANQAAD
jgi:hypothetical protein